MSGGELSRSPSESLIDYDVTTDPETVAEAEAATHTNNNNTGSSRPAGNPTFLNRRTKIVNGNIDSFKDRKQARNRRNRDSEKRKTSESMKKDRDRKSTDSGLGRTSVEDIDSPTMEDHVKRKGWESESGDPSDSGGGGGGGHRALEKTTKGQRGLTGGIGVKKEEMARLEKELEQEMRYR